MALSFDPEQLPVRSVDTHLPPVPTGELELSALRRRFDAPPAWTPEIANEGRITSRPPAHAAVLIGLMPRPGGLAVLLTQRTDHLTDHPGQISFPGGRAEPTDADAAATALREAHEEVGLEADYVRVLGTLPAYTTGTGFIVTPVVAEVLPGCTLAPEPFEVAEVFEVPLGFLMTPTHHRHHSVTIDGTSRSFLSMPWEGTDAQGRSKRYFIWGATAAMLRNLYGFLSAG